MFGKDFEAKHWALMGAMLVAFGTQLSGLEHGWSDALTPGFIGGMLISMGTTIAAVFVGAPKDTAHVARDMNTGVPAGTSTGTGTGSGTGSNSIIPKILLIGALGLGIVPLSACAPPPTIQSPQAKAAWRADQVVVRLGEFQQVVIDGSDQGKWPVQDARTIVQWTTGAIETLGRAPNGGSAVIAEGWSRVRTVVSKYPGLVIWAPVVDELLAGGTR